MGQCSVTCCRVSQLSKKQSSSQTPGIHVENIRRPSINDSGHSSTATPSPNQDNKISSPHPQQRCSQSSDSSGKFSFKESINSSTDFDKSSKGVLRGMEDLLHPYDVSVFLEEDEEKLAANISSVQCPPDEKRRKKRSMSAIGQKRATSFFRTRSSSTQYHKWSKTFDGNESPQKGRSRRAVSLKLTKSRHLQDVESKVPTVYIEEDCDSKPSNRRKSSIRKALSLLSLDSMHKESSRSNSRSAKPVQKILRHPTRRHTTVRGVSGLAIDGRSRASYRDGLQRGHSLVYYPTNTSIRTALSHTYSSDLY